MTEFKMTPIGYIRCPKLKTKDNISDKGSDEKFKAEAVLNDEFTEALDEIEAFDRVWLIFVFDRNVDEGYKIKFRPHPDPSKKRALFVTRSPYRPNPIGLSCVRVLGHEKNILYFENSDILDGSPLLDIKPYIPGGDSWPDSKAGWLDSRRGS